MPLNYVGLWNNGWKPHMGQLAAGTQAYKSPYLRSHRELQLQLTIRSFFTGYITVLQCHPPWVGMFGIAQV